MYAYMGIYRKHINQNSLQIKKILKKGKTKKKRKKKKPKSLKGLAGRLWTFCTYFPL